MNPPTPIDPETVAQVQVIIQDARCAAHGVSSVIFDNIDMSIGFLKVLAGDITQAAYLGLMQTLVDNADMIHQMQQVLHACLGTPT